VTDEACVEPYSGDTGDLVARLRWLKDQTECTKPGREQVWAEFDAVIAFVEDVLEAGNGARAEVEHLRAGEDHTPRTEALWPTPGQWIARWNAASPEERLDLATRTLEAAQTASDCFAADHMGRLEQVEHWRRQAVLASELEAALARHGLVPPSVDVEMLGRPGILDDTNTCTVRFSARFPTAVEVEAQAWLGGWAERIMGRFPPNPDARFGEWHTEPPPATGPEVSP
jgi:hypothetical protein